MPPDNRNESVPDADEYLPFDSSEEIIEAENEVSAFQNRTVWKDRSHYLASIEEQNLRAMYEGRKGRIVPVGVTPQQPCPALEPVTKGMSKRALSLVAPRPATVPVARPAVIGVTSSNVNRIIRMPARDGQAAQPRESGAPKAPLPFPAQRPTLTRAMADGAAQEAFRCVEKMAAFSKSESVDRFLDEIIGETVILDTALRLEKCGIKVDRDISRVIVRQYITTRFKIA